MSGGVDPSYQAPPPEEITAEGVDRAHLRFNLRLTPAQRLERLMQAQRSFRGWHGIARRQRLLAAREVHGR